MASTPKKQKREDIVGFLHNVSPIKTSSRNNKYFNAVVQTNHGFDNLVSFKSETHKTFIEMEAAKTPVCIEDAETIPSLSKPGKFDLNFGSRSRLSCPAKPLTFSYKEHKEDLSPNKSIKNIKESGKQYEQVSFCCKVVNVANSVDIKENLKKTEVSVADNTDVIKLTLWNEQSQDVTCGDCFRIEKATVHIYSDQISVSANKDTKLIKIQDIGPIAMKKMTTEKKPIDAVECTKNKSCINCKKSINHDHNQQTVKCTYCNKKQLVSSLAESLTIKINSNGREFLLSIHMLKKHLNNIEHLDQDEIEDFLLLQSEAIFFDGELLEIVKKEKKK